MKRIYTLSFFLIFSLCGIAQDTIFYETFTGYVDSGTYTVPAGWTINSNGSYTTSFVTSSSGQPAFKFDSSTDSITTPAFSNADSIQFWLKGASTDTVSSLTILETSDSITWDTLVFIDHIATSGTLKKYAVNSSSVLLRFRYTKSAGNIGFDDVLLTGPQVISANFSAPNRCLGDSTCFTDLSTTLAGTIVSWQWDFGDGSTDSVQNPCHLFSTAGDFTVQLQVINSNSDTGLVTRTISIGAFPVASFTPGDSIGCGPLTMNFSSTSTISFGTISTYDWDFGNGTSSGAADTVITFSTSDTLNISLAVSSDLGCSDTAFSTVIVNEPPQIDTTLLALTTPDCGASNGAISGISVNGNSPFTYNWTPGSQTTIDLNGVPAGSYIFEVIDVNNCSAFLPVYLSSTGAPAVSLSSSDDTICEGTTINFSATPSGLNSYTFYVNGTIIQDSSINSFSYSTFINGDTVTATGTQAGCVSPASNTVMITVEPFADATIDQAGPYCPNDAFDTLTAAQTGGIWSGNGITDFVAGTFNPAIAGAGTFTITYSISGNCGNSDTIQIVVNQSDSVSINGAGPFCFSDSAVNLSAAPSGGIWSGNGITDSISGTFDPKETGDNINTIYYTSTGLCGSTDSISIIVNPLPVINISQDTPICSGNSVQLSASGGVIYSWSPAAGLSNDSIADPLASPDSTTTYTVSVTDTNACTNVDSTTITVNPNPVANFAYFFTQDEDSVNIQLADSSTDASSWLWSFGDGSTSTTQNPLLTYKCLDSALKVSLTVTSAEGCTDSTSQDLFFICSGIDEFAHANSVSVSPNPSHGIFRINISSSINDEIEIMVSNILGEIIYKSFVDTATSSEIDLSAQPEGTYFIILKANGEVATRKAILVR